MMGAPLGTIKIRRTERVPGGRPHKLYNNHPGNSSAEKYILSDRIMLPRLFAFDLDGTLLTGGKRLSPANENALHEMAEAGAVIAFASGRLGSSMQKLVPATLPDVAMLTLNGAAVYTGRSKGARKILDIPLSNTAADCLVDHALNKPFGLNYYIDGRLYAVNNQTTAPWLGLYYEQTGTEYHYVENLDAFRGRRPSKIIFVGPPALLDEQETYFRRRWGASVYVCRTWDYYLEFMDPRVNKAAGLEALAKEYGVEWPQVAAFGDAENDIPMLEKAGQGIAMANASTEVKRAAGRVSPWTNDEDGVAKEWERMKKEL
jgi:Cof subfamily protein (haloacid dehalogenase superfamily)